MSISRFQLQEYGDSVAVPIGRITKEEVERANQKWQQVLDLPQSPFQIDTSAGVLKIRAIGVTGVIRIGDTDIEIVPKFLNGKHPRWQTALWKILSAVSNSAGDDMPTRASDGGDSSFVDFLADLFISSFLTGSARGLPRTYCSEKSEGPIVRGSFDASRATEFLVEPWRVPYVVDVLSEDTQLARLLRWASNSLMGLVSSSSRGRALNNIVDTLSYVGNFPPHIIDARQIELGSQYRGLELAKNIGILLLEGGGLAHENGQLELPGFLWRSNTVYEEFVFSVCESVAKEIGLTVSKAQYHFGEVLNGIGKPLSTIPDLVFRDKFGKVFAIADAKYKRFIVEGKPAPADTYQMITAGHILGGSQVALIYPSDARHEFTTWKIGSKLNADNIFLSALHINVMDILNDSGKVEVGRPILEWLIACARGGRLKECAD